jgi:hypothetical protein
MYKLGDFVIFRSYSKFHAGKVVYVTGAVSTISSAHALCVTDLMTLESLGWYHTMFFRPLEEACPQN